MGAHIHSEEESIPLFQTSWLRLQRPNNLPLFYSGWASIHNLKRWPLLWVHITFLLRLIKLIFMPSFSHLMFSDRKFSKSRDHTLFITQVSRVIVFNFYHASCGRLYFPESCMCACVCVSIIIRSKSIIYKWLWHSFQECQFLTPDRCVCVCSYLPPTPNLSRNLKLPHSAESGITLVSWIQLFE